MLSLFRRRTVNFPQQGLLQALAVSLYCGLVGILFWQGNNLFGNRPNYFGPVAFLLLFIVSALICGLLVFYQPYRLFFWGKKKEALDLVLYTTVWLLIFLSVLLLMAALSYF